MEDSTRCPKCGHDAVRLRRVNPRGIEIRSWSIWLFFGVSVLILIGSFFGTYGAGGNQLLYALPGLVLVLVAIFFLYLFSQMPKRYTCDNAHTWELP